MSELENICTKNTEDLAYLFWRVMKLWQRETQRKLDEFNTTTSQLEILGSVYHLSEFYKKEVTQSQVSAFTDIDPMTTSTILRNLEKKGFVERRQSQNDTRARSINITQKGMNLFQKAYGKVEMSNKRLLDSIDAESIKVEMSKLLSVLESVNNIDK